MATPVVKRIIRPVEQFLQLESSSGIMLMFATAVALIWANSPWHESYEHFIHTLIGFSIGGFSMEYSLHYWVNDGLMVIFFFVVGLEIKRELIVGELSTPRKAALPMFAALGGMVAPALIYYVQNTSGLGTSGWGIPMATDIAFAVGILTLMGRKVPFALKIFLLALAIVDDLGAVMVIAFFYTEQITPMALGFASLGLGLTYLFRYAGVRKHLVYILLGIFVWFCVLKSGVHATVAGVLIGLITPLKPLYPLYNIPERMKDIVLQLGSEIKSSFNDKQSAKNDAAELCLSHSATEKLDDLLHLSIEAQNPLSRSIHYLHPWVSFMIMPVFALVNAGVDIRGVEFSDIVTNNITLGVFLGLLLGKPIGVTLLAYLATKLKLAELPTGVTWTHIVAVGFLAGIGFTMALFISNLALKVPELEVYSKMGILLASTVAGLIGSGILYFLPDQPRLRSPEDDE